MSIGQPKYAFKVNLQLLTVFLLIALLVGRHAPQYLWVIGVAWIVACFLPLFNSKEEMVESSKEHWNSVNMTVTKVDYIEKTEHSPAFTRLEVCIDEYDLPACYRTETETPPMIFGFERMDETLGYGPKRLLLGQRLHGELSFNPVIKAFTVRLSSQKTEETSPYIGKLRVA